MKQKMEVCDLVPRPDTVSLDSCLVGIDPGSAHPHGLLSSIFILTKLLGLGSDPHPVAYFLNAYLFEDILVNVH